MAPALLQSEIDGLPLIHRGKVRETYEIDDRHLLLVASDRLSAFDVVFDQPIPDKGRVLTRLSEYWFDRLAGLGPTHFVTTDADRLPEAARTDDLAGRTMLVRRAERIDAECVVRGYLAGSGWAEYRRDGMVSGHRLPGELREAERLPAPIFTPSTKAEVGHDENISREQLADLVGADLARQLEGRSIELYLAGARRAEEVGLILADKQFVRDFVAASGWKKEPPAPALPADVIAGTRERYVTAYERLTGQRWNTA